MTPTTVATRDPLRTTFEPSSYGLTQPDPPMWPLLGLPFLVWFAYCHLPTMGFELAIGAGLFALVLGFIGGVVSMAILAVADFVRHMPRFKLVATDVFNPGT